MDLLRRAVRDLKSFLKDASCLGWLGVVYVGQHRPCIVQGNVVDPGPSLCCPPCLHWHLPLWGQQQGGGDVQMCARPSVQGLDA